MEFIEQYYLEHRLALLEGYGRLVEHVLKYRPGLFRGMPLFQYEICELQDRDILLLQTNGQRESLHVLLTPMFFRAEASRSKWLLPSFSLGDGRHLLGHRL